MKKKKGKSVLITLLIVVLDLLVVYFGADLLAIYKLGLTNVYVTSLSIKERTCISEDMLKIKKIPKAYVNEDIYLDINDIVGKYVKLNTGIPKGSLIYKDSIDDISSMKDNVHMELKKGETTYDLFTRNVKVNPAHLLKGMNIDLYLTINRKEIVSDLLISNAKIIGLYDVNNKEIKDYDRDSTLGTISIAVKKDMVPYLNKALTIGEVSLLVSYELYDGKDPLMNTSSIIFEYLKW